MSYSTKQQRRKGGDKPEFPTPEAVSEYIASQRVILIENLEFQRKNLVALIEGRELELQFYAKMVVAKGLVDRDNKLEGELRILRRRLFMVESKEKQLQKYQAEAMSKTAAKEGEDSKSSDEAQILPARNYSRKIRSQAVVG